MIINNGQLMKSVALIGTSIFIGINSPIHTSDSVSENYINSYYISRLKKEDFGNNLDKDLISFNMYENKNQGDSLSLKLTKNLTKLKMIQNLHLGEDKSITFSEEFVNSISNLLISLTYQPKVFPNFRGNIQLEYEEDNGKYLEIEITPDMKMNIFKIDDEGNEYENDIFIDANINEIIQEVKDFYGYC